jgi:Family of unknown function (DUF6481)
VSSVDGLCQRQIEQNERIGVASVHAGDDIEDIHRTNWKDRMKNRHDLGFGDRLSAGAKAKAEQLERARARLKENAATAEERQQARQKLVAERDARTAARAAAKREEAERLHAQRLAEAEREAAQRHAEEEARFTAAREATEAAARKKEEEHAKLAQILTDQKAARDARYAARKTRAGKK